MSHEELQEPLGRAAVLGLPQEQSLVSSLVSSGTCANASSDKSSFAVSGISSDISAL